MGGLTHLENVLFDLDGTLVDSSGTIASSLVHALEKAGMDAGDQEAVESYIGVPLFDIFIGGFGMSESQALKAIDDYRAYYDALQQAGTQVYNGIPEVLAGLRDKGYQLYIATVKPTEIAEKVLGDLELRPYFDGVAGASMGPERRDKRSIIAHALETFGLDASRSIMVGDRDQDIEGARSNGMRSLGVTYGFGSRNEVAGCGPDHLADAAGDIAGLLIR